MLETRISYVYVRTMLNNAEHTHPPSTAARQGRRTWWPKSEASIVERLQGVFGTSGRNILEYLMSDFSASRRENDR